MSDKQRVVDLEISEEVESSFLDYAMSVITSRALPDVRDGLKPVHRRVLFAMHQLGIGPNTPHKKSARIVGEIIGKFHPHGDAAVYGTLVRLAQDFSMRYPLVDGHGNFGSVDGDSAAAMRYTEARLSPLALEMLRDIDKETVDFVPNYDNEEMEPAVLPARFPNILANGVQGIAVGMATNMLPHNLREVCMAIVKAIDMDENFTVRDLLGCIRGPDFPTGGIVTNANALPAIYSTGSGTVHVEAKVEIEEQRGGRRALVISELPYMVNKASLVARIAELVKEKKIDGIHDIRDESDRSGMRIVIELKKDAPADVVREKLMRQTPLRTSFSVKNLVLENGKPKVMNLKDLVQAYVNHQVEVIRRRTEYDLKKVEERIHVLEGLLVAQDNIDEVIRIVKNSRDTDTAKKSLAERFSISETQASAIVAMRISGLTSLESDKVRNELAENRRKREEYSEILSSRRNILQVLKREVEELAEKFGDDRRTEIVTREAKSREENILETIPDERVIVSVTRRGYLKRAPENGIVRQRRGNRARVMTKLADDDFVTQVFSASTRDSVLLFTDDGIVHKIAVYDIPEKSKAARGMHVGSLLGKELKGSVQAIVPLSGEATHAVFVTEKGYVKKTSLSDFDHITRAGLVAMFVRPKDRVVNVVPVKKGDEILICTRDGNVIRFREESLPEMPRDSFGQLGIRIDKTDCVVDVGVVSDKNSQKKVVVVTSNGFGKLVDLAEYRVQRHGGRGIRTTHTENAKGEIAGLRVVGEGDEIVLVTNTGEISRQPVEGIAEYSRYAQGVKLLPLSPDSRVVAVSAICADEED